MSQLKRLGGEGLNHTTKSTKNIQYQEELDMAEFTISGDEEASDTQYALCGVIVHTTVTALSAHYYAYVRRQDGRWWKCNDSCVCEVRAKVG